MLIDDVTIKISAGKGGEGKVAFEKSRMAKGPTGGNGGAGGSVYLEGVSNLSALKQFRYQKEVKANNGEGGMGQLKDGSKGEDVILRIPVGTIIHNLSNGQTQEITKVGEKILIAEGGKGGKGNNYFKSSTNTTPLHAQKGLPGEAFTVRLELKLIADVGLIGLPNAGKSSLINVLTNSKSKIGAYQFTTLEPSLGDMHGYILADIPGLIEGASEGRGLGHKFLRHIKRTAVLLHCLSLENEDVVSAYKIIRKELEDYSPELAEKQEVVILTKTDMVDEKTLEKAEKKISKFNKNILSATVLDDKSIKNLKDNLIKILRKAEKGTDK